MKKNKLDKIGIVISIMLLLVSVVCIGMLLSMGVLPIKYLGTLLILYIPVVILLILFMLKRKVKKGYKVGAEIFSVLLVFIMAFGSFYLYKTMDFMGDIKEKKYQVEHYYVLVPIDSKYQKLEDIQGESVATMKGVSDTYEDALALLEKKISVTIKNYNQLTSVANDLLNQRINVLFLSETSKSLMEDENHRIEGKLKIIATIDVKVKNETVKKEVDVTKDAFNIYISGIDTYGDISSISRSDVNILATIHPKTHKVLLTSIPRDYYVQLHGTTGYKDKLTHAGIYGIDKSVTTIEDLLDVDINYYVRVNFTTLISLVDAIGGINVYSDYTFKAISGERFVRGNNDLNGKTALAFARERHAFVDGDRQRGKNQQKVLSAIMTKAMSSKTLIMKYTNILESLSKSFQTNMGSNKIYELVNMQLDQMPAWNIESISVDGYDSSAFTYSYPGQKLYVMQQNLDSVSSARDRIKAVMNGS